MIRSFNDKNPQIAKNAFISETAYVIGDVKIGENSSVWPGAVIRGDFARIEIGNNTQIEDNCIVHNGAAQFIGDNVHIGHGAVIHCAKIANNVLVGMNATLLDGAEIGSYSIIGANSMVSEGMIIPDYSFVIGIPAIIKGEVSKTQIERIELGVREYVKITKQYLDSGL